MRKAAKWLLGLGLIFTSAVLLVFVLLRTGQGESFFCQFRMFSPDDVLWQGPIQVGKEWTRIDAPKPLKAIPFTQHIELLASPETHILNIIDLDAHADPNNISFWRMTGGFEEIKTGKRNFFEVKIEDVNGRSVQLMQNSLWYETTGDAPRPAILFNLHHDQWKKMIFHSDFESHVIYVRASSPIVLDSIKWSASYYYRHPCKTWEEVNPERIFNFDELPPPARH